MSNQYGVFAPIEPTKRQQLFETVKNKAAECVDMTHLCAAIYPWILDLVREYTGKSYTITQWERAADSFRADLYDFRQALSVYISTIPGVVSPDSRPLDIERIRNEALDAAISMAVEIARIESVQISIQLSAIMARFVKDL